jgi:hypothetical protein
VRAQVNVFRAVPELAVAVGAPALDPARGQQRARVEIAGADRLDPARQADDGDGLSQLSFEELFIEASN